MRLIRIRINDDLLHYFAARLLCALALFFLFPTVAAGANRREIVEEAFTAYAKTTSAERKSEIAGTCTVEFAPQKARLVRLVIRRTNGGQACLDELEVYGPDSPANLALAKGGAVARASSLLPGYAIHAVPHLNDGLYGNDHSWIAAGTGEEWAQIELPEAAQVLRVVISRDRKGQFSDREVLEAEVRLSTDGRAWQTVGIVNRTASQLRAGLAQSVIPFRRAA